MAFKTHLQKMKGFYESEKLVKEMGREPGYLKGFRKRLTTTALNRPGKVAELLAPAIKGKVLDVGIGGGPLVKRLPNADIHGIDISRLLLKKAGERGAKPVLATGESMPFKPRSFDSAMCLEVIGHLREPTEVVREIRRVLKPGGRLVISAIERDREMEELTGAPGPEKYRSFTRKQVEKILKAGGLSVDEVRRVSLSPISPFSHKVMFFYATKKK